MPDESYRVKLNRRYIEKYKNKASFDVLNATDTKELKDKISPLITTFGEDELAKRVDFVMYTIEMACHQHLKEKLPLCIQKEIEKLEKQ